MKLAVAAFAVAFVPSHATVRAHVTIDVMFAYTPSVDAPHALAAQALADTNRANAASGVDVTFRVAGVVPVASREGDRSIERIYADLSRHRDFAEAHAARTARRADVLVLLVDAPERGMSGLAPVMATAETAVAVVAYRGAIANLTVAHELGHIMGARHDIADDDRELPFAYGHGYRGPAGRTIMAMPSREVPLLRRWSMGETADANDARVLRATAPSVAAFGERL